MEFIFPFNSRESLVDNYCEVSRFSESFITPWQGLLSGEVKATQLVLEVIRFSTHSIVRYCSRGSLGIHLWLVHISSLQCTAFFKKLLVPLQRASPRNCNSKVIGLNFEDVFRNHYYKVNHSLNFSKRKNEQNKISKSDLANEHFNPIYYGFSEDVSFITKEVRAESKSPSVMLGSQVSNDFLCVFGDVCQKSVRHPLWNYL